MYVRTKAGNDGVSRIIFMHRALCLAFLRYGSDINKLVVNHLDGSPSNNRLDNLEFTTYSKNNKHAYDNGLRPNASKVVFMKNLTTGVIKRFNSVSECARELGHSSPTFIILRIRDNPTKVYSDMLMFKYDDGSDWPYIDMNNLSVCRMGNGMDIQARNVFTGEIFIFAGTYAGSRITGVNHATILKHVNTNAVIPTDGFNFRFHSNNLDWPQHTERHLMIYRKYPKYPPDGVIMLDTTNNEEIFFVSEKEAAEHLRCNKHHISKSIKTKTLFRERYSLKKFNIRKTLGPSEE